MLRFAELFCGAGGLSLGLKQAGFEPQWAIDNNPEACETYAKNIGEHIYCSNVESFVYHSMPQVDGMAFGFPCNDFSLVGKQKGLDGYFGGLYLEAARALEACRPKWFIGENVPGLLKNGVDQVMQAFADTGYTLYVHKYDASLYGVPQRRQRVIAVGIRSDLQYVYHPPIPFEHVISARDALANVQAVPYNNEIPRTSDSVKELLRSIPPGHNCWHEDTNEAFRPNVKGARLSCLYRRLHPDEPSPTVLASGGGGTYGYHYEELRALTNRERARLQGFPDDFVFQGKQSSVRKQIGMAVPPPLMKHIGMALRKAFDGGDSSPNMLLSVGIWSPQR